MYLSIKSFYIGEVRKVYPGGWDNAEMLKKLNQGFIDYRNRVARASATEAA